MAHGTPTYRASASQNFSGDASWTINKPAGVVEGDLMIVSLAMPSASRTVTSWPSGWTQLAAEDNGSDWQSILGYKVCGASEPSSWEFGISTAADGRAAFVAYYDVDTADPFDDFYSSENESDATAATTGVNMSCSQAGNLHVIVTHWRDISTYSNTTEPPSGYTERLDAHTSGTYHAHVCDKVIASSGTLSSVTVTYDNAYDYVLIELLINYAPNVAPNAPTGLTRMAYDARAVGRFSWTFDDDNLVDSQTAFKLRIREQGTGTWYYAQSDGTLDTTEVWITSVNEYFDLDADELTNGTIYEWSVNTKDDQGVEGSFTSEVTVTPAAAAVFIEVNSPADAADVTTASQAFSIYADSNNSTDCTVYVEIDTVNTFDGANLIQLNDTDASGSTFGFNQALTGSQTWYWRARAKRTDDTYSDWTATRTLNVDTGGALPASITPAPSAASFYVNDDYQQTFTATVDHVLTPTTADTLKLECEVDTAADFLTAESFLSAFVGGGDTASVTVTLRAPGTYYIRFRTAALYGNASAWDDYTITVTDTQPFVENPSWQAQVGPRPNRVYVLIEGGSTYYTAEVPAVSADDKIDYWASVPSGTTAGEAQDTADAILAVLQARPILVSGPIPLNVTIGFDREITAQWWEVDGASTTMRDTATLVLSAKRHNIDAGTTHLSLGDYVPSDAEALARILAKLSRA